MFRARRGRINRSQHSPEFGAATKAAMARSALCGSRSSFLVESLLIDDEESALSGSEESGSDLVRSALRGSRCSLAKLVGRQ